MHYLKNLCSVAAIVAVLILVSTGCGQSPKAGDPKKLSAPIPAPTDPVTQKQLQDFENRMINLLNEHKQETKLRFEKNEDRQDKFETWTKKEFEKTNAEVTSLGVRMKTVEGKVICLETDMKKVKENQTQFEKLLADANGDIAKVKCDTDAAILLVKADVSKGLKSLEDDKLRFEKMIKDENGRKIEVKVINSPPTSSTCCNTCVAPNCSPTRTQIVTQTVPVYTPVYTPTPVYYYYPATSTYYSWYNGYWYDYSGYNGWGYYPTYVSRGYWGSRYYW